MLMSAPGPRARDAVLVGILAAVAIVEGVVRRDLDWPIPVMAVTVLACVGLPWRRTHPLLLAVVVTALSSGFVVTQALAGVGHDSLGASLGLILLPYSLWRWGTGRAPVIGSIVFGAGAALSVALGGEGIPSAVAAVAFVGGACLAGALRRERVAARERQWELVRAREREALARDLHDTVAHRVTAIALHAQAAARSIGDSALVAESLRVIESEAKSGLDEMRSLVTSLRTAADYGPAGDLTAVEALATPGPPEVVVRVQADVVPPELVAATLVRIAREGVTNARRHARGATRIDVEVGADAAGATVTVRDDGAAAHASGGDGFGIRGMRERVALLGGTLDAGPHPGGGWLVRATLPRKDRP
jgi:signal transduction histidine kinase